MRLTRPGFLTTLSCLCVSFQLFSQNQVVDQINRYGTFDNWCVREIKESGIIGGRTCYLYEFYGNRDTIKSETPFVAPKGYLWRTNNVMAVVSGVVKTSNTVYPEKRGDGYCARIETHIESVKALGIVNMEVTCQGALMIGVLKEPIRDTKSPMTKVRYGTDFQGRPTAVKFDYKADVGHSSVKATGFSKAKNTGIPDYPEIAVILQKRWEDEDGNVFALRVGTGIERMMRDAPEWVNGHRIEIKYGDITGRKDYEDYMGLVTDPERLFYTENSKGKTVAVDEIGWAPSDEEPNYLIIKILSSCGLPFCGGIGNTVWIDNFELEM